MSILRPCHDDKHCLHEVADDGTFPVWCVHWTGDETVTPSQKRYLSEERHSRLQALRTTHPVYRRWEEPDEQEKEAGMIGNREICFVHKSHAEGEYNWLKGLLIKRGDWLTQQDRLFITQERANWEEVFGEGAVWLA